MQVLGQVLAGLLLLMTRPFQIDELVSISGENGVVSDISTLFTPVLKADGRKVVVLSNSILGNESIWEWGDDFGVVGALALACSCLRVWSGYKNDELDRLSAEDASLDGLHVEHK